MRSKGASPPVQSQSIADLLLRTVEAEEMRRSLKQFVIGAWRYVDPSPFVDGWCLDAMCDHLTALSLRQIRFLLINIPPRHSKSSICSVIWPVWDWLQRPEERFLCASYGLNLAIRDNLKKRNLIESQWFQERYGQDFKLSDANQSMEFIREKEFILNPQQNAKRFFMNDKMGYQLAVSVGSTTTGEGGSILNIDDMHSASEAHSTAERESANTWFREVWSSRMNDASKDCMIVIGQRIHSEDVSGIILNERQDWVHLNLPAEFEPHRKCFTVLGWEDPRTEEGELLWPERFNHETLARYKRDLGSIGFSAQYQQSPVPSGGGQFKREWFRYFTETDQAYILETASGARSILKAQCNEFATVDLAISSKQSADYTVFALWAMTPEHDLILFDLVHSRMSNLDQLKQIRLLHQQYPKVYFKIERTGYQLALIQQSLAEGIPCKEYLPIHDKVSRASTASIWMENGKFYFRKNASWLNDAETELLLFPRAAHDDIVDVVSMAANEAISSAVPLSGDDAYEEDTSPSLQIIVANDPFAWAAQNIWGDD